MNKQETVIVVLLFGLLLAWFHFVQKPQAQARMAEETRISETQGTPTDQEFVAAPEIEATGTVSNAVEEIEPLADGPAQIASRAKEARVRIANDVVDVQISSWGAGVAAATLLRYPNSPKDNSSALILDFSDMPALAVNGIPGLSTNEDFTLSPSEDGRSVVAERTTAQGLFFKRTIAIRDGYTLDIVDSFSNSCDEALSVPTHDMLLGPMRNYDKDSSGIQTLGADILIAGSEPKVLHLGGKIMSAFGGSGGCASKNLDGAPPSAKFDAATSAIWVCVKSKFFAQIFAPLEPASNVTILATRNLTDTKQAPLNNVAAIASLQGFDIQPGQVVTMPATYYVGPKNYSHLRQAGSHWAEVMEFGKIRVFRWICEGLLWMLNALTTVIPNYGVAIIVLTFIVRMIFWPITHKSTESMKKMQKLQPEMQRIRQKFKDNPQKMNQEVMALYQVHKVNPLAGCLPLVVQIPVFIALFTVLRSAVELRYAGFLWIADLSAPERIIEFSAALPLVGWDALNILPFLMTATMVWQQKLTPTTGDPQQQTLMMIMPVMMLFFLYNMPSALCLYWTTSQCLSIAQLTWQRRKSPPTTKKPA